MNYKFDFVELKFRKLNFFGVKELKELSLRSGVKAE